MNVNGSKSGTEDPILHVLVVGFHHKRGYEVEYCYPPVRSSLEHPHLEKNFPPEWKDIASLAIPDGAHNVESDIIYFLLPSAEEHNRAIYGISCYRQIAADDDLREKDEEVTRSSVQKSVCVLSKSPLYGVLKSKLEVITQAYFNEKDFTKVEVLVQMYNNLCDLFDSNYLDTQTIYTGISLQPLLKLYKHRALVLFKLILLEKRTIFNIFPVHVLGNIMVGLISLFPKLLDKGLFEAASYSVVRNSNKPVDADIGGTSNIDEIHIDVPSVLQVFDESNGDKEKTNLQNLSVVETAQNATFLDVELNKSSATSNPSSFETDEYGFPLSIFTKGSVFHPYLGISYMDMLKSDNIRAYCVGVTNSIFTLNQEFIDVIVSMSDKEEGLLNILSPELRRQLTLTKQDLRFVDFLLKVLELNNDPALWEGSDDWLRAQFHGYLLAMLAAAHSENEECVYEFNPDFIKAWRTKHNYRVWSCSTHAKFDDISPRHPFAGQLSVNDVILRMNHAMNASEQGRKVMSTFANTGKLVAETGSRFKSSFTSWMKGSNNNNSSSSVINDVSDNDNREKSIDYCSSASEEIETKK